MIPVHDDVHRPAADNDRRARARRRPFLNPPAIFDREGDLTALYCQSRQIERAPDGKNRQSNCALTWGGICSVLTCEQVVVGGYDAQLARDRRLVDITAKEIEPTTVPLPSAF